MIKLGVCAPAENARIIAEAGFDYIECSLATVAAMSDADYAAALDSILGSPIRAEAFNIMIPVKVTGPEVSLVDIRKYLDTALPRAAAMGAKVIVFGSGGARRVPDGYCMDEAYDDVVSYLRLAGDRCAKYGITIAIEPLNLNECNILNSVSEAVWVAHRVDHAAVKVLVDNYHSLKDGLSFMEVRAAGPLMAHTHVSHPNRSFPVPGDGYDYTEFLNPLKDIGYAGRMSVEGRTEDFAGDVVKSFAVLNPLR